MTRRDTGRTATLERPDSPDRLEGSGNRPDHSDSDDRRALVGGDGDYAHPPEERTYLGQMGTAAFYRCETCGGAIIRW